MGKRLHLAGFQLPIPLDRQRDCLRFITHGGNRKRMVLRGLLWVKGELAAEEQDANPVILEAAEAPCG